ncbi:MAG: phosphoribosylglycinamide formyltransferase [Deltaproteobacteria bacterium]|nr:phosphoribosylglycinamide formyltransferase [Deltaproteobacteria bacterium]
MIKIGVLVSGSGTNLQSIIDASFRGEVDGEVAIVISNNASAFALTRAEDKGIPTRVVSHKGFPDRRRFDMELVKVLNGFNVDLVALAGFMRVLTPEFLEHFPGRVMNIHPALLPSFPGLGVRQKAIDHGVRFSGCTVHFVDQGVDTGPIIIQATVPVYPDDREEQLQERILRLEHKIYPKAIQLFAQGRLKIEGRKVFIDGLKKDEDQCMINPPLHI